MKKKSIIWIDNNSELKIHHSNKNDFKLLQNWILEKILFLLT